MARKKNKASNAAFTKTKATGVVFIAPTGTVLPTGAFDELNEAFQNVGYISTDGITWKTDTDTQTLEDMGGTTIASVISKYSETAEFTMLEVLNIDAAKLRFGSENVIETANGGLQIDHKMPTGEKFSMVVDAVLTNGAKHRMVIPEMTVNETSEYKQASSEALSYGVTVSLSPFDEYDGATVREFIDFKKKNPGTVNTVASPSSGN
ncbi:hypothetical protein [Alloscardovia omnicolens]|uniref:phage tail tube protein n=2 Tax=Actinomycetes TaxID=1760 RepID=UPI0003B5C269|nr:hypothetical protein [Alloscardovia omnicolens]